jgi:protoporphyrinogen oxidase
MSQDVPRRWCILGGGILGLALARELAGAGAAVTVFEAGSEVGGLAAAWTLGDVTWDRHYHVTLLSDTALRGLLTELDLERDMRWVETRTGFYTQGRLYSMSNTLEFLTFPPLGLVDKLRLGLTILHASRLKNWRRLEGISVGEWLRRWSGRNTFEKIWLPLLRAKLGENYKNTSAAFIWSTIARMYAARRTGLKKEMFGYLPGGYARMLARFVVDLESKGVGVRLKHSVRSVQEADGKVSVSFENGAHEIFDEAVITFPAPLALRVCPGLNDEERIRLAGIQYQGVICASILLAKPLSGFYVTNITDDWVPFTAVIEMSALVDRDHFGGHTLVYLPKYLAPDDPMFGLSDTEVEERFIPALIRMYPHLDRADVLFTRISRVRHVVALPTLNYSQRLPPMTTSIPGLHIVNSAHIVNGTLNVNETLQLARRACSALLRSTVPTATCGVDL